MANHEPLLPGSTLGVIGGGQLGRYFVLEARRLGYDTWVLDPDPTAPAMQLAAHPLVARYDDKQALSSLALACDAVTIEFENVPADSLQHVAGITRLAPTADLVAIAQDRTAEKRCALEAGLEPVPYAVIETETDIESAIASIKLPGIMKTARLGYDGKGQVRCSSPDDVRAAFAACGGVISVLEQRIELAAELSVVLARGFDGTTTFFPIAENVHRDGILFTSTVPSRQTDDTLSEARRLAGSLAGKIDYHGVLAIEFFVTSEGRLLFNEMAPRPHNSGHYTLDATRVSQFEAQLRVLCALPAGDTSLQSPVTMFNLLGELWNEQSPDWLPVVASEAARLHLYGKAAARPGRKMGHVNCLAESAAESLAEATRLYRALRPVPG